MTCLAKIGFDGWKVATDAGKAVSYLTFVRHQPFILSVNPEAFFIFFQVAHLLETYSVQPNNVLTNLPVIIFLIKSKVINIESDLNLISN